MTIDNNIKLKLKRSYNLDKCESFIYIYNPFYKNYYNHFQSNNQHNQKLMKFNKTLSFYKPFILLILLTLFQFSFAFSIINQNNQHTNLLIQDANIQTQNQAKALQLYQTGKKLYNQQKLDKAVQYYQKAIQLNPTHKESYFQLATTLFYLHRHMQAQITQKKAIQLDHLYKQAYNGLGNALFCQGYSQQAKVNYNKALSIDQNYPNPYNGLGKIQQRQGNYQKAIYYFKRTLQLDQNYIKAYHNLGRLYLERQSFQQAETLFLKGIEKYPTNHVEYKYYVESLAYIKAIEYQIKCDKMLAIRKKFIQNYSQMDQKQYLESMNLQIVYCLFYSISDQIKQLIQNIGVNVLEKTNFFKIQDEKIIDLESKNNSNQTDFYFEQENSIYAVVRNTFQILNKHYMQSNQELIKRYQTSKKLYTQEQILMALGDFFSIKRKFAIATKFYQMALGINQNSSEAYLKIANLYKVQGDFQLSETYFKKSISVDENNLDIYQSYAELLAVKESYQQAKQQLKKGILNNNKSIQLYNILYQFQTLSNCTSHNSTISLLIQVIQEYPDWKQGFQMLYKIYQQKGEFQKAIQVLTKLIQNNNFSSENYYYRKREQLIQDSNKLKENQKLFNLAISNNISSKTLFQNLAEQFKFLGRLQNSIDSYKKVIQIDSSNGNAFHNIGNLYYEKHNYFQAVKNYAKLLDFNDYSNFFIRNMSICLLKIIQMQSKSQTHPILINSLNIQQIRQKIKQKLNCNSYYQYYNDHYTCMNIGQSYKLQGNDQRAIQIYQKLIQQGKSQLKQYDYYSGGTLKLYVQQKVIQVTGNSHLIKKQYKQALNCFQWILSSTLRINLEKKIQLLRKISEIKELIKEQKTKEILV